MKYNLNLKRMRRWVRKWEMEIVLVFSITTVVIMVLSVLYVIKTWHKY